MIINITVYCQTRPLQFFFSIKTAIYSDAFTAPRTLVGMLHLTLDLMQAEPFEMEGQSSIIKP